MANLFYPQLTSGALAQYPIQKTRATRTIRNVMPDGNMVLYSDSNFNRLVWELEYQELSSSDSVALQAHFAACSGPFRGFTFVDPTDNMLSSSIDLTQPVWVKATPLKITQANDPDGGTGAFLLSNLGQTDGSIGQTIQVPANYQYCLSVYVAGTSSFEASLFRKGTQDARSESIQVTPNWTRFISGGRLNDSGTTLTVGMTIPTGQQVQVFGMQLEAQVSPSAYRATDGSGGVYANAHWLNTGLVVTAEGPNLFSTNAVIETSL